MSRRTETAYKAESLGKAAQHVKAQGSGDRVNAAVVGSGRQGCNLAGGSPAISIARFGYVAIPQFLWVTTSPLRGVNGLAALKNWFSAVDAIWGPSKYGSLNITE